MDCPICDGNGELDYIAEETDSVSNIGVRALGRQCVGSSLNTCYRCNGTGFLEDETIT